MIVRLVLDKYYLTRTRGVASVAIRTIAIAAECLTDLTEQREILTILEKIKKETGWRIDFLKPELKKKWGWNENYLQQQQMPNMMHTPPMDFQYQQAPTSLPPAPPVPPIPPVNQIPRGIVNPLMRTADFSAPTHPYQNYYVAPNQHHNEAHYFYSLLNQP